MDTSNNTLSENLGSVSIPADKKEFLDGLIDWASENPFTAFLTTLAIGTVGYSIYNNANKPETTFKSKSKKRTQSPKQEETKEPFSFAKTFGSYLKKHPEVKDSPVDMPNVVAAVTTAAATVTLATTKIVSSTYVAIAGGAVAGIGFLSESPIVMIAGAGLLVGSILKMMLGKTVKPQADVAGAESISNTSETTAVSGVSESSNTTGDMNGTGLTGAPEDDFQGYDPPNPFAAPGTSTSFDNVLNGAHSSKSNKLFEEEDYDFDRM